MNLYHLPTFRVTAISEGYLTALFDDDKWIGENHITCIIGEDARFIWGRLADVDLAASSCMFVADRRDELHLLSIDQLYPRLDGYWGERAQLVLDRSIQWQERTFVPLDAVAFDTDSGEIICKESDGPSEKGETVKGDTAKGVVIKGGWDHEHCEICWATISPTDRSTGMFAEPKHWICCDCYQQFVLPGSLSFIAAGE